MAKVTFNKDGDMVDENGNAVSMHDFPRSISTNDDGTISYTLDNVGIDDEATSDFMERMSKEYESRMERICSENATESNDGEPSANGFHNHQEPIPAAICNSSFSNAASKYFVLPTSSFTIRFGLVQMDDGRFVPIKGDSIDKIPDCESHWVKFRMWTYLEELQWKDQCTEYDSKQKIQTINTVKLNEMKLKRLMLEWSFGEYDDKLKLLHCDGRLSDESYGVFCGMFPSIANTIVDLMNLVLEGNQ